MPRVFRSPVVKERPPRRGSVLISRGPDRYGRKYTWNKPPRSPHKERKNSRKKRLFFYMVREMGLEPTRLWLDTGTSSLPVYLFQHSRVCPKARAIILMGSGNVKQKDYLQRNGFPSALKSAIRLKRAASGVSSGAFCLTAAVIRSGFTTGSEADTVTRTRTAFSSGINERPRI